MAVNRLSTERERLVTASISENSSIALEIPITRDAVPVGDAAEDRVGK